MTDPQPTLPDPRTASDDDPVAKEHENDGESAPAPAEGADDAEPRTEGSPGG